MLLLITVFACVGLFLCVYALLHSTLRVVMCVSFSSVFLPLHLCCTLYRVPYDSRTKTNQNTFIEYMKLSTQ